MTTFIVPTFPNRARVSLGSSENVARRRPRWTSELVAVVGATGGVGRTVINRLLDFQETQLTSTDLSEMKAKDFRNTMAPTKIRALVRNAERANEILPLKHDVLTVYELPPIARKNKDTDMEGSEDDNRIREALKGVEVFIICTGTTAFPTKAWRGGNTPKAVDDEFVQRMVAAVDVTTIKRIVLASSIGTGRTGEFPFFILNAFGVLDAKRSGEEHVRASAKNNGHAYSIIRLGRLVGEPKTNVGAFDYVRRPDWLDVSVERGDIISGDLSRAAAAEAIVYAAHWNVDADLDFSAVNCDGPSPSPEKWRQLLRKVESSNTERKLLTSNSKS